ncbi:MAG: HD domain-containing protein [Pirellulales bacterium]
MPLTSRFTAALVYAAELHAAQTRKVSGVPYVAHLLGVCGIVLEQGGDEDEAIGALLHDAIEDQGHGGRTREEILTRFGPRVLEVVEGCTDTDLTPKPPWRARKEAYIAHLPAASASTRLVSAADKLYNARAILSDLRQVGAAVWDRFNGGRDGTLWYYRALADAYRAAGTNPIVEELDRVVRELTRLAAQEPAE